MKSLNSITPGIRMLLFWCIMYLYLLSSYWFREPDKLYVCIYIFAKVLLQFLFSVFLLKIFIPKVLNRHKKVLFVVCIVLGIYVIQFLYGVVHVYFFETVFSEVYAMRPPFHIVNRMGSFVIFINNVTWVVFPSVILIALQYYRDQKDIIALKEQKKTTELNLLKHQLNPHFLFNTLNNLYVLALKKSDNTPEAIAKLSEILDYMLYQCKDTFVPIKKEIELLENYIGLEKIRYGNRVELSFERVIENDTLIAPLLLLTFVENAFKHGISQELKTGVIELHITATPREIVFRLKNSKPTVYDPNIIADKEAIGMQNTQKQLDLLYPNSYSLNIEDTDNQYALLLKLIPHEKV